MRDRNVVLFLAVVVVVSGSGVTGCKWKKKKAQGADAAAEPVLTGVPMNTPAVASPPPPVVPPPPVDPLSAADHALIDRSMTGVKNLDALVKKGLVTDPAQPGEGDLSARCSTLEDASPKLAPLPDPDGTLRKLTSEIRRLCSFEAPIIDANHALKQLNVATSQASQRLVCGLARKDFDKARKERPNDRKVFELGQRLAAGCR